MNTKLLKRSILLFVNKKKANVLSVVKDITVWCKSNDITLHERGYLSSPISKKEDLSIYQNEVMNLGVDFIVVLGGDGTLLRAARSFSSLKLPMLPVAGGNLGFLMYIPAENAVEAINEIYKNNKMETESRLMLRGSFTMGERVIYGLNEIVITHENRTRLAKFSVKIANRLINNYSADGLIVSTATGSSAYNLSAGGPLIYPSNRSITLTPVSQHSLSARPIVLSPDHPIEIELPKNSKDLTIIADGQELRKLVPNQKLIIKKSPYDLILIKSSFAISYFESLRSKLGWGR